MPKPIASWTPSLAVVCGVSLLTLLGCSISPQPEPPTDLTPEVDTGQIEINTTTSGLRVAGGPGAATPGELRLYNLEAAGIRVDAPVAEDGSFTVDVEGAGGDRLRLQVRTPEGVSEPADITGVGPATRVTTPLEDCLFFNPAAQIDFGAVGINDFQVARVHMENQCAADVSLFDIGVLVGEPSFSFIVPTDPVIPQGESRLFGVAFAPSSSGEREDVLILGLEAGTERRAVTIRGAGVP